MEKDIEKYYKRRVLKGGSLYEAEMFYIPYFVLDKGVLKAKGEVSKKFKWLEDLTKKTKVYYGIFKGEEQGIYYTLKNRMNKEQFCLDVSKGVIINEY